VTFSSLSSRRYRRVVEETSRDVTRSLACKMPSCEGVKFGEGECCAYCGFIYPNCVSGLCLHLQEEDADALGLQLNVKVRWCTIFLWFIVVSQCVFYTWGMTSFAYGTDVYRSIMLSVIWGCVFVLGIICWYECVKSLGQVRYNCCVKYVRYQGHSFSVNGYTCVQQGVGVEHGNRCLLAM
jgi:hypothetical protein